MATCTRCGTFLCGECTELLGEAAWCASCVDFLRRNGPASLAVKVTLGLEVAGLLLLPLLALLGRLGLALPLPAPAVLMLLMGLNLLAFILGLWLPRRALRSIERGDAPLQGRPLARWAQWMAWANLVLLLLCGWGSFAFIP